MGLWQDIDSEHITLMPSIKIIPILIKELKQQVNYDNRYHSNPYDMVNCHIDNFKIDYELNSNVINSLRHVLPKHSKIIVGPPSGRIHSKHLAIGRKTKFTSDLKLISHKFLLELLQQTSL